MAYFWAISDISGHMGSVLKPEVVGTPGDWSVGQLTGGW